jgi:hypothetical protein
MGTDRRSFLKDALAGYAAVKASTLFAAAQKHTALCQRCSEARQCGLQTNRDGRGGGPPEMFKMYLDLIENGALTDSTHQDSY